MAGNSHKLPEGFHTLTPILCVSDAIAAIKFYERVFDASVKERHEEDSGRVSNAVLAIGDSSLMLSDELSEHAKEHAGEGWPKSPESLRGSSGAVYVYIGEVDAVFARAIAAGARVISPVEDKPWGDRVGSFEDPFGHIWNVATYSKRLPH